MGAGQRESHAPFPSPRKVCHAIAEEATHTEWPELLPHVATALQPTGGASAQCAPTLYFLLEKLIEAGPQPMCAHANRCVPKTSTLGGGGCDNDDDEALTAPLPSSSA